jgi:hypothetical protein
MTPLNRRSVFRLSAAAGAAALTVGHPAAAEIETRARSLDEAIRVFNANAKDHSIGKMQPPLREEEVIAAIRWARIHASDLPVSDETLETLERIARVKELPAGFDLEVLSGYEPNDEVTFDVWSIRLRIPREPGGTTCVMIREQWVKSREIGPEERRVIAEWRRKEQERGGIGSFERVDRMREYRRARAEAAHKDQAP